MLQIQHVLVIHDSSQKTFDILFIFVSIQNSNFVDGKECSQLLMIFFMLSYIQSVHLIWGKDGKTVCGDTVVKLAFQIVSDHWIVSVLTVCSSQPSCNTILCLTIMISCLIPNDVDTLWNKISLNQKQRSSISSFSKKWKIIWNHINKIDPKLRIRSWWKTLEMTTEIICPCGIILSWDNDKWKICFSRSERR